MTKLFPDLPKYKQKNKVSAGIKFGKGLLKSWVSNSLTSVIECH